MSIVPWTGMPVPTRFIPGREADEVTHQGFGLKRAPILTRWTVLRATIEWSALTHEERNTLDGFVERVRGRERAAHVPWFFYQRRHGGLDGAANLETQGATSAGARIVPATGWVGSSPYLTVDDMIGFQVDIGGEKVQRIHRLTDNVTDSDFDMNIWPPLREDLADNSPIYFMPSTAGGTDGRFQPSAAPVNGDWDATYLQNTMMLEDPASVGVEGHPTTVQGLGHFGLGGTMSFVDAVWTAY